MKFHTLIALSEFEARFDDATLRRPLVARRNPEAAGGGPASEPSRNPEAPAIIPDDDTPQPGMLLPGILDDAPRPVGDAPQPDTAAPRNLMVLPPKLDDAPQPDTVAPRNPMVLPPKLGDAAQPAGDAPQPDTVAPANPMVLPPKLDDAPQPAGDTPRPVGGAPQPAGDTPQPAGDAPQPVGNAPRPIGDAPQQVGDAPQPVGVAPQPVGVASNRTDGSSSKKALSPGGDDGPKLVDKSGSSIEVQLQHHKDTSAEVQALLQAYHQEVDAFERRMNRYEQDVEAFNRGAGARPATAREQKRLVAEEAALQRLGRELNAQGEALQLADQWLRANASRINDRVESARANQRRTNDRIRAEFLREETPEGVITREDTDGDGKIDRKTLTDPDGNVASETQYHYAEDGTIDRVVVTTPEGVETHLDTDGDGKFDQITLIDAEGNQTSDTEYHYTDDGTIDRMVVTTPEGVETHLDADGDGKIDQRTLIDPDGNQTSDTQYHFADDGKIDRIVVTTPEGVETHLDTDGDGKIDQKTLIDTEGNQTSDTVYRYADDGTIDRIVVTTPEGVETHRDTDGDGKIDQKTLIDPEGNQTTNTVYHYTDDGTIDRIVVTTPEGVETHRDTDGDGKIDRETLTDPDGNQTTDTEYHYADDGTIDRITVTTPEGVTVHTDSDVDGAFDTLEVRDAEGNVLSHTVYADTEGDGAFDQATVTTPEGTRVHTDSDGDGFFENVPDAGSSGDAMDLLDRLTDGGSSGASGQWSRAQRTGTWYNASELEDDSGINLEHVHYRVVNENTIVANGPVSINRRDAGVQTTYTRNSDGTITIQSRIIGYHKDDAPGSGGGGGGSSRDYTVAADGTVSYTENGHTYTVSDDDLAQAVRDAVASGDASGLSSVDTTTVTNSDGQVMAYSLSSTDAINTVVASAQGVFNPYQPTANNGTPHPESGQPVYFDGAGNTFYDAGLSNPVDDQAQAYFSGMLDTDHDGVPDSRDGVVGSMGNEFTVAVPDRFLPDAVRPVIPTFGDIQANAAALPAAAAARGIDTTGLSIGDISQKVFIHDQTAFVEQFLGPDAVPDGQAPTPEQLAQAQEMYDDVVASLNTQVQGFTIGRVTSDVPPAGVEVGGRQGFDQGLALAELQVDLQRVAEGKSSLTAVLAKWQADPRGSTLMLEGPRERLYSEEVGEYEGLPTTISATEWLSLAVAEDSAQRAAYQDTPEYREMLIAQEVGGFNSTLGMVPVGLDEMAAAQARNDYQAWLAETQRILPTEQELERGQRDRTEAFLGSVAMDLPSGVATSELTAADVERLRAEAAGELPGDFATWEAHQQEIIRQLDNAESSDEMVNWFATAYPGQTPPTVAEVEAARAKVLGETGDLYVDPQRRPIAPGGHSVGAWMPDQESEYNVEAQEYNRRLTNRSIALELGFLQVGEANAHPRRIRGPVEQFFQQGTAATGLPMDWVIPAAGFIDAVALSRYSGGPAGRLVTRGEARGVAIETALLGADLLPLPGPSGLVKAGGAVVRGVSRLQPIKRFGSGFLMSATPYESVPRLITPQLSEAGLDASLALRRQLAETGHAEISIGGKVYTVSGDRFDQAMRLKNPNAPTLAYHADTDLTYQIAGGEVPHQMRPKLADNQPVLDTSGEPVFSFKGPSEQFEFLAPGGPVTGFSLSRAFGSKNAPPFWVRARQHPGVTAYDIPFDELAVPGARSEPGGVNYFHGRELEVGVPTSEAELAYRQGTQMVLPATQGKVGIGPRLNEFLYLPETLEEPGYWMRTKANLLGLADRVDPSLQPGISVRSATREDVLLDAVGDRGSWVDVRTTRARTGDFWVDEAIDPSVREARAQVVLLDNGTLRRLVDDPATPANIQQAADDLLDVRRTTRARTGDFWVDEAIDPSVREARAQVVLLDNGTLRRLVDDPATPANIQQAADDLLDVRRTTRARTGDFWVDEAIDPSVREARAQVVLLDNGTLRRLVDDPATPANIRQAADDLLDVRRTTTIDRPTIRTESRSMGRDISVPHGRVAENIRQTFEHPRTAQSDSWVDLRAPDLRAPDLRAPDLRAPDLRAPDLRTPDLRTPDLRAPDLRAPDLRTPDLRAPDLRTPDLRTTDLRTPDLRTPDLRTPDLRTPDLRTTDLRTTDLRTPDLRTPDPRIPDLRTPDPLIPDPRIPDPRIPDPRIPDPRIPDPRIPDPRIPDPRIPDPRIPDPRIPDPRIPDPRTPDPRTPDPRTPDPRTPDPRTPDLTRQRRVRLPEVDEAPMTVVKAEEGLYPRVVAHDELIRVYHDLDTGEVRTEPLAMPTEPIIVKHDDTPPPIESRFAGHRRITPRGGYVFTKPVGERRRKASSKRHPYLRKGELRRR